MATEKRLIDPTEYKSFLKRYINDFYEIDAPMIAGAVERCLQKLEMQPSVDAIVPPVKIGQVLWCNIPHSEFPLECRVYCICREERNGPVLDYFRCVVKGWFGKAFSFEDIGKSIFLTREEAEAALAKMDGERKDNG